MKLSHGMTQRTEALSQGHTAQAALRGLSGRKKPSEADFKCLYMASTMWDGDCQRNGGKPWRCVL